jgi:hypothetical protein
MLMSSMRGLIPAPSEPLTVFTSPRRMVERRLADRLDSFAGYGEVFWTARRESDICFANMGLGTKNRQNQTAELCKEHLRAKYPAQRTLVEDFIREIEGTGKACDPTQWSNFTDVSRDTGKMVERLDEQFSKWLSGDV